MKIKFYNTLHHKLESFKPINDGIVKIYSCGPTVYDYAHIGNLSTYLRTDILRRILEYFGYNVYQVMNITDVGHLVNDDDAGEDKLEKGAKREGKTVWEIAKFYENAFKNDIKKLNIENPEVFARATDHIKEQILMVKILEKKGFAYRINDGIYFDTSKIKNYGELANLDAQKQIAGARVEVNPEKKNPEDFALWKFEERGIKRQMVWNTPWGKRTFPGWHIECSAMSIKYLGEQFDIHTGGVDHIGVHHTNEIAQNQAATGHKVVNYWIHFEHLLFENHKISKSAGSFIKLTDIEKKNFNPLALRYLILTANYRHKLNFTWKSLKIAQESLESLYRHIQNLYSRKAGKIISTYKKEFLKCLANNLDTPQALAVLWKLVKADAKKEDIYKTILDFDRVLGLKLDLIKPIKISKNIQDLVQKMDQVREEKDWKQADKIRNELEKKGYIVKNTDNGSIIEKA